MSWSSFTGDTLYLDTNVLIFAVEQGNPWTELLRELFVAIDDRAIHAFTSELAIAEVLSKPLAVGASDLVDKYERLLSGDGVIKVVPIDRPILRLAAELQGEFSVKLLDALHLATARVHASDFFLSNDERLGRKLDKSPRWLSLSDVSKERD